MTNDQLAKQLLTKQICNNCKYMFDANVYSRLINKEKEYTHLEIGSCKAWELEGNDDIKKN